MISFKTAAGDDGAIHKQIYNIVCFGDASGRLRVDVAATARGKQDPSKQGRRSILIYKFYMYSEASPDPEKCIFKMDQKAYKQWVSAHARQIRQFEDASNPPYNARDEEMETETERADPGGREHNTRQAYPLHSDSGAHAPEEGTSKGEAGRGATAAGLIPPTAPPHLRFGTPAHPTVPIRARGGTLSDNTYPAKHKSRYAPLR